MKKLFDLLVGTIFGCLTITLLTQAPMLYEHPTPTTLFGAVLSFALGMTSLGGAIHLHMKTKRDIRDCRASDHTTKFLNSGVIMSIVMILLFFGSELLSGWWWMGGVALASILAICANGSERWRRRALFTAIPMVLIGAVCTVPMGINGSSSLAYSILKIALFWVILLFGASLWTPWSELKKLPREAALAIKRMVAYRRASKDKRRQMDLDAVKEELLTRFIHICKTREPKRFGDAPRATPLAREDWEKKLREEAAALEAEAEEEVTPYLRSRSLVANDDHLS